ncbi:hypothetical protein RSAG8_00576, partial [Rhizoctonia solani AG-8 WAC10335]
MHSSGCVLIRGQSIIAVFAKPPVERRFISNVQRIVLEWRIYLDNPYRRLHSAELCCLVISRLIPPATAVPPLGGILIRGLCITTNFQLAIMMSRVI